MAHFSFKIKKCKQKQFDSQMMYKRTDLINSGESLPSYTRWTRRGPSVCMAWKKMETPPSFTYVPFKYSDYGKLGSVTLSFLSTLCHLCWKACMQKHYLAWVYFVTQYLVPPSLARQCCWFSSLPNAEQRATEGNWVIFTCNWPCL